MQFAGQVACAAPGIKDSQTGNITSKFPENGIGVQYPVSVSVISNLRVPVIGNPIPECSCFFSFVAVHVSSWLTLVVTTQVLGPQ